MHALDGIAALLQFGDYIRRNGGFLLVFVVFVEEVLSMIFHLESPDKASIFLFKIHPLKLADIATLDHSLCLLFDEPVSVAIAEQQVLSIEQQLHRNDTERPHIDLLRVFDALLVDTVEQLPRTITKRVAWNHYLIVRLRVFVTAVEVVIEHTETIINDENIKVIIQWVAVAGYNDILWLQVMMNDVRVKVQIFQLLQDFVHNLGDNALFLCCVRVEQRQKRQRRE